MAGGHLYGWYATGSTWVKMVCNAAGELITNIVAFLENPPTEDEANKAPTSEWAFDHDADVSAHHTKYTDAEARGSINDMFDAEGKLINNLNCNINQLFFVSTFRMQGSINDLYDRRLIPVIDLKELRFVCYEHGVGYTNINLFRYNGIGWEKMATEVIIDTKIIAALENPPTEDEAEKAPTSEWAFDHDADAAAHHAKYTDLEAQTACKLNGTLYWSCPGIHFDSSEPDVKDISKSSGGWISANADNIFFSASVNLPDGATITGAFVNGNAAATDEQWHLRRIKISDATSDILATGDISTDDTSIDHATVDNSTYAYFLTTSSLDTDDQIYGAYISYTI